MTFIRPCFGADNSLSLDLGNWNISGQVVTATGNQLNSAGTSSFLSIKQQLFTSSGTYSPTNGMAFCIVEVVGAGGGGGGVDSVALQSAGAGGGGSGAYSRSIFTTSDIGGSQTVTIGSGGVGGVAGNNNGSDGGSTSLGSLIEADGGHGGFGAAASASFGVGIYGAGGGSATGALVVNGNEGALGQSYGPNMLGIGGAGGNSIYGSGGPQLVNQAGHDGFNYGSGGGGASSADTGAAAGGNGTDGIVIITEYVAFASIA